jgi:hypothetical protein
VSQGIKEFTMLNSAENHVYYLPEYEKYCHFMVKICCTTINSSIFCHCLTKLTEEALSILSQLVWGFWKDKLYQSNLSSLMRHLAPKLRIYVSLTKVQLSLN